MTGLRVRPSYRHGPTNHPYPGGDLMTTIRENPPPGCELTPCRVPCRRNKAHAKGSVNGPGKLPPFDPVFPLFEDDRHPYGAPRQERQIVQSCNNLDGFLPGFAPSEGHLSGVRSNQLSYRPG